MFRSGNQAQARVMTYPTVSVIIPTYTRARWDWLHECVASAQAQTVPALEIIVVVDHNPELLEEITGEFPDVIAVPNIGGRGVSGARNSGVKASRGEVVAFLDDDSIAAPDWLATLLRHIVTPASSVSAVTATGSGMTRAPPGSPANSAGPSACRTPGCPRRRPRCATCGRAPCSSSGARSRSSTASARTSGRSATSSLPEDTDLCLRIAAVQDNAVWMWDPAKVMKHRVPAGRATFGYLMSRCFLQGWGKAAMAHMDGFDESTSIERNYALRILPAGVGRGLADAVRGDVSGLGRSGAIVAAFSVTVGGYLWYLLESLFRKRARSGSSAASA